ncbi:MAG: DNA polymerase III subunit delta [Pseudomonadota bacterium]
MKLRLDQLAATVAEQLGSVYLVSGDETLLTNEAADTIRSACRAAGYLERTLLSADRGFNWADLDGELSGLSLFSDKRLVELRLPSAKPGKKGSEAISGAAARLPPDTVLLIQCPKLDKGAARSAWVSAIETAGIHVQTWPIDNNEFPSWVAARMRARGLEPARDAVLALCARVEGNLLAADQEIEKLWLQHGAGAIDADAIADGVGDSARFSVFRLADVALAGHTRKALRVLRSLRHEGAEPVLLLWSLTREIRSLYGIRHAVESGVQQATAINKARVWGARQGIVRAALGRHSVASLRRLLIAAELADRAARGRTLTGPWDHITGLVVALAGSAESGIRSAA